MTQRMRTIGISAFCRMSGWVSKIHRETPEINWLDRLRWFLEGLLSRFFSWCYDGSDEEIRDAFDGGIPVRYLSARQYAALGLPNPYYLAYCIHCRWAGLLGEAKDHLCPVCRNPLYLDEIAREGTQ